MRLPRHQRRQPERQLRSGGIRRRARPALLGAQVSGTVALLVALSSCATGGEDNWNSTAVGDDKSIGALDLRSVLLVTDAEGAPARILGTFENTTSQPIELTISDDDEEIRLTVAEQGSIALDTTETLLRTSGDAPGARTTLVATTAEGSVDLLVPVVDGTLDPYRPYLPD